MTKFPVLTLVSNIMKISGWIVVATGVIAAFALPAMGRSLNTPPGFAGFMGFMMGLGIALYGLGVVALGESIGVLFAIEANTRKLAEK